MGTKKEHKEVEEYLEQFKEKLDKPKDDQFKIRMEKQNLNFTTVKA